MERWARRRDVERLERELAGVSDPERRRILEEIIGRERARIAALMSRAPPSAASKPPKPDPGPSPRGPKAG